MKENEALFLDASTREAAERVSSRFPPVKDMVKTRTRYVDDMLDAQIAKATGDASLTVLIESFASMRAPWVSGIDDIRALANELGLRVVENVSTGDLYRSYRGPSRVIDDLPALFDLHARIVA